MLAQILGASAFPVPLPDNALCEHIQLIKSNAKNGNSLYVGSHAGWSEDAYFGVNDEPVSIVSGFSRWTVKCDEYGNETEIEYFDAANKPFLYMNTHAKMTKNMMCAAIRPRWPATGQTDSRR